MNNLVLFVVILIPAILVGIFIIRMNRNQLRLLRSKQPGKTEFENGPRDALEAEAQVVSRNDTISPEARGIAKVDLQVEVHLRGQAAYQVTTTWLVEEKSLELLTPGKNVPVKVDPKKQQRVFPNVPWARPWLF